MPSPTENVFLLLKQKKYEDIIPLIQEDDSLVNAINPDNGRSLLQMFVKIKATDESRRLLQFVLAHPKINFQFENQFDQTNLDEMISSAKMEVFEASIRNAQILFNRDKLTYECAKEYLVLIETSLKKDLQKDPNSAATASSKARKATLEEVIALLRDATILYAIHTDDVRLMDRLEQSGANPSERLGALGDNKLPVHFLTPANRNLSLWFKARFDKTVTSIARNPHSFLSAAKELERLEAQLAEVERKHLDAKSVVHKKGIERDIEIVDRVITSLS